MPDYKNGKIYKLVNDIDDLFYVGSTTQSLSNRKSQHFSDCKYRRKNRHVYDHFIKVGIENVHIILIENYPCHNREELSSRERFWVDQLMPSLNTNRPHRTCEEKRLTGIASKHRYYNNNKNTLSEKAKEKCYCSVCSKLVRKADICKHMKTKTHWKLFDLDPLNFLSIMFVQH